MGRSLCLMEKKTHAGTLTRLVPSVKAHHQIHSFRVFGTYVVYVYMYYCAIHVAHVL